MRSHPARRTALTCARVMKNQQQRRQSRPAALEGNRGASRFRRAARAGAVITLLVLAGWASYSFLRQQPPSAVGRIPDVVASNASPAALPPASDAPLTKADRERQKDASAAELNAAANSLLKAGDLAAAVIAYQKALEQTPNDEDLHYNLGIAFVKMGNLTNAESEYREALRLLPDYPEVHNNFGTLLMRMDRLPEAEEHLKEAIKQMPEYAQAHNNLGILRQRQKRSDEALACFQKAVDLDTNYWEARFNLANTYLQRHEREKGIEQLKEAVRLNPSSELANRALQRALARSE